MNREDLIRMAKKSGLLFNEDYGTVKAQQIHAGRIDAFANLIASHVAEECAKVCDELDSKYPFNAPECFEMPISTDCANAIRQLYKQTAET